MHARAGRTGGFTRALPIMIGMASALAACTKRAGSEAVTAGQYAQIEQADLPTEALSDWTTLYGAATLAELEREREGLLAYFLERSKPAFAARFASGDSVLSLQRAFHVAGSEAVFAEIYPSLFAATPKPGEVKDEAQVRGCCERFNALDEKGQLAALFGPAKEDARREVVEREEGWILGVNA